MNFITIKWIYDLFYKRRPIRLCVCVCVCVCVTCCCRRDWWMRMRAHARRGERRGDMVDVCVGVCVSVCAYRNSAEGEIILCLAHSLFCLWGSAVLIETVTDWLSQSTSQAPASVNNGSDFFFKWTNPFFGPGAVLYLRTCLLFPKHTH